MRYEDGKPRHSPARGMKRANHPRSTKIEEGRIYGLEMVQKFKIKTNGVEEQIRGQS